MPLADSEAVGAPESASAPELQRVTLVGGSDVLTPGLTVLAQRASD